MFSKRFELSPHDQKQIAIYGAYLVVAVMVLYPSQLTQYLINHGVSTEIVSGGLAFLLYVLKKFLKDNSMEDPLNVLDGSMEGDEDDDDMLLEGENAMLDKLSKVATADEIRISYSQYVDSRTKSACTLFSPLGVVSSIYNKQLTQSEIMECWDFAVKEFGYKVGRGAYFETGVRCVVKRWNIKFPDQKVMYFKTQHGTDEIKQVLLKGYGVCGGYKGNQKYNQDRLDGVLEGTQFGDTNYGHATSRHSINGEMRCYDSIPSMMRYKFKNDPAKISGWYKNCYVILPEKEVPKKVVSKLQAIRQKRGLDKYNQNSLIESLIIK